MSNLAHDAQTIARICEETSDDLKEATQGITVLSAKTQQERDWYRREALAGRNDDWATFDDELSAQALIDIRKALDLPADDFKLHAGLILSNLLAVVATAHALRCEENGTI